MFLFLLLFSVYTLFFEIRSFVTSLFVQLLSWCAILLDLLLRMTLWLEVSANIKISQLGTHAYR